MKSQGRKIAVVVSQFNEVISRRLLKACLGELIRRGVKKSDIAVHWVPGSLEIPLLALKLAKKKDAVIALGAVIRGETLHYELVARGVAEGIMRVSLRTGKPIIFGVLTTDTFKQAQARAQDKGENKGRDAAQAALSMIDLLKSI